MHPLGPYSPLPPFTQAKVKLVKYLRRAVSQAAASTPIAADLEAAAAKLSHVLGQIDSFGAQGAQPVPQDAAAGADRKLKACLALAASAGAATAKEAAAERAKARAEKAAKKVSTPKGSSWGGMCRSEERKQCRIYGLSGCWSGSLKALVSSCCNAGGQAGRGTRCPRGVGWDNAGRCCW